MHEEIRKLRSSSWSVKYEVRGCVMNVDRMNCRFILDRFHAWRSSSNSTLIGYNDYLAKFRLGFPFTFLKKKERERDREKEKRREGRKGEEKGK